MIAEHQGLGLTAEPISLESAHELEPSLGLNAAAAAALPDEGMLDPRLLMGALLAGGQARGVEIRPNSGVTSLCLHREKCTGVVAGTERISAEYVVIAAGCFSRAVRQRVCRPIGLHTDQSGARTNVSVAAAPSEIGAYFAVRSRLSGAPYGRTNPRGKHTGKCRFREPCDGRGGAAEFSRPRLNSALGWRTPRFWKPGRVCGPGARMIFPFSAQLKSED